MAFTLNLTHTDDVQLAELAKAMGGISKTRVVSILITAAVADNPAIRDVIVEQFRAKLNAQSEKVEA